MSALLENTVAAGQGQQFYFNRAVVGLSDPQTLFQVPVGQPARIEAVYFEATFPASNPSDEAFVLTLTLADGTAVYSQPTPPFNSSNNQIVICTWARGNNDTAQLPGFVSKVIEGDLPAYGNPPLPDLVLPALAFVTLALWEDSNDNSGDVIVTNPAVTYTMGAGPTSSTALADVLPLLTPTDEG